MPQVTSSNVTVDRDAIADLFGARSASPALGSNSQDDLRQSTADMFSGVSTAPLASSLAPQEESDNRILRHIFGRMAEAVMTITRANVAIPAGAERLAAAITDKVGISLPRPLEELVRRTYYTEQIAREFYGVEENKLFTGISTMVGAVGNGIGWMRALQYAKPLVFAATGSKVGAGVFEAILPQQLMFASSAGVKARKALALGGATGFGGALFEAGAFPESDITDIALGGLIGTAAGAGIGSLAIRKGAKIKAEMGLTEFPDDVLTGVLHGNTEVPTKLTRYLAQIDAQDDILRAASVMEESLDEQSLLGVSLALQHGGRKNITGSLRGVNLTNDDFFELWNTFPGYRFELVPEEGFQTLLYGAAPVTREGKSIGYLTDSAIDFYKRNGFMLGQRAMVDGSEVTVSAIVGKRLRVLNPNKAGYPFDLVDRDKVMFLDDVANSFGGEDIFGRFVAFREATTNTWDEAFESFTESLPDFDPMLRRPLRNFLVGRETQRLLSRITPDAGSDLRQFHKALSRSRASGPLPGDFEANAASRGFMVTRVSRGRINLTRVSDGDTRLFRNEEHATAYLQDYRNGGAVDLTPSMREVPGDVFNGISGAQAPPNPSIPPDFEGAGINAALKLPRNKFLNGMVRGPLRVAQLAEDRGKDFEKLLNIPVWSEGMQPVSLGATRAMNRAAPYLERVRNIARLVPDKRRPTIRGWLTSELKDIYEASNKMSPREIRAAKSLRQLFNDLFDDLSRSSGVDLDVDVWFRNYAPDIQEHINVTGSVDGFERIWRGRQGGLPNEVQFFAEMFKSGELSFTEMDDIFVLAAKYTRGGLFKAEAGRAFEDAVTFTKTIRDPDTQRFMTEYLMSLRGFPEYSQQQLTEVLTNTMGGLGATMSPQQVRGIVGDLWAMNAGALMSWRPGLVMRNATQNIQLLAPLLPRGFSRVGSAMARASTKANKEYATAIGAVRRQAPITRAEALEGLPGAGKVRHAAREFTRIGLKPYSNTDQWNRAVAAIAVRDAIDDTYKLYQAGKATLNDVAKAGIMHAQDAPVRAKFFQILQQEGIEEARDFAAREAANFVHFLYGSVNSPQWVRRAFGKFFGNYSTFPFGYANWARRVAGMESLSDKVSALAKHGSVNAALLSAKGLRINLLSWMPFWAMGYTGGPFTQAAADAWNVAKGFTQVVRGYEPAPDYNLSLSRLPSHVKLIIPGSTLLSTDIRRATERLDENAAALAVLESLGVRTDDPEPLF